MGYPVEWFSESWNIKAIGHFACEQNTVRDSTSKSLFNFSDNATSSTFISSLFCFCEHKSRSELFYSEHIDTKITTCTENPKRLAIHPLTVLTLLFFVEELGGPTKEPACNFEKFWGVQGHQLRWFL